VTPDRVLELLQQVADGTARPEAALERLAWLPIEAVGAEGDAAFARLDHHRALRVGHPEVVFGAGKTVNQTVAICERLAARDGTFLVTRASDEALEALTHVFPQVRINRIARTAWLGPTESAPQPGLGKLLIACAGTSDLPVAEEAAETARAFGNPVETSYDIGVAGLHRLLQEADRLRSADIVIVAAGMEGALPSVLGGLVRVPVIAVPTSVGYGASFGGLAALLGMLNSCASGITVVNIDNGFGAACAATRINQLLARARHS